MNIKQQITLAVEHMLNNELDYAPLNFDWEKLSDDASCMFVAKYDSVTKQEGLFLFMGERNLGTIRL